MDDSSFDNEPFNVWPGSDARRSEQALTLALLEDLAAVLQAHGFPPLRGYVLVELTSSLYRAAVDDVEVAARETGCQATWCALFKAVTQWDLGSGMVLPYVCHFPSRVLWSSS